jgi:hypothetical protein
MLLWNHSRLWFLESVRESFLCRSREKKREVGYGAGLSYRDSLPDVYDKVVVAGKVVGNGDQVSLQVGELYFRLSQAEFEKLGIKRNDFLWFNRPYTGDLNTNASKTGGTMQYTLEFGENVRVSGLIVPNVTQNIMTNSGSNCKSVEKTAHDFRKRQKTMWALLSNLKIWDIEEGWYWIWARGKGL